MVSPSTTRKNKAAVHWNLEAVSLMIAYVNTYKGPDSPFLKNQANALALLGNRLRPLLSADDASRVEPNKIRDKLTHIWKNRKAKYTQVRDFWTHGLDALNITALENEYPDMDFDRINDWIDEVHDDDNLPETSSTKRDRSESSDEDDVPKARAGKKPRTEEEDSPAARSSVSHLDREIAQALLRSRDGNGNEIFDSEDEDMAKDKAAPVDAPGVAADPDPTTADRRQSGGKPCPPPFANRTPAHWSLTPVPGYTLKEQQFYTNFCSAEAISGNVDTIRKQITAAVTKYLAGLGFDVAQPVSFDINANQSPEFRGLLNVIMGYTPMTDWVLIKPILEGVFDPKYGAYSLFVFVEAFVGAALTAWCFVAYDGHAWFANNAMDPGVLALLRRDMKDKDFQRFKLDAIRNNVSTKFAAGIPKAAAEQAVAFDKLLPSMLPGRSTRLANGQTMEASPMPWDAAAVDLSGGARVFKMPQTPLRQTGNSSADSPTKSAAALNELHEAWIQDLTAIFSNALLLRAFMECPWERGSLSNIVYAFTYPGYYQTKSEQDENRLVVRAGVFPQIDMIETKLDFPNLGGYVEDPRPAVKVVAAKSKQVSLN